jgi:hypothetical protein
MRAIQNDDSITGDTCFPVLLPRQYSTKFTSGKQKQMTSYIFSITILCLAAINADHASALPQEMIASRFQEQISDNIDRIRKVLIVESQRQHTIVPCLKNYLHQTICDESKKMVIIQFPFDTHTSLPQLLVYSSRPIRAPVA